MVKRLKDTQNYWGALVLDWFTHLQDNELSGSDYKVLFFLCEKMQASDNSIYLRQKQIAQELSMDKGNVSKCIKMLSEKQFIVKKPNGFMINPNLFYVGKRSRELREMIRLEFYKLLIAQEKTPRFYLHEDEHILEVTDLERQQLDETEGMF
ncbi:helix-turn-helix domain-containing protein [Peribacillus sp. R9-11]|uniref:MarR family transcriptional regulator n=1 Tax=Peribacillus sp. R9-11 TaxID=3073271 RepID=UPI0028693A5A|nr:helix-turn-helix domain-containing protein [Peribacillus sp. R9-11]WMX58956.1 helix-turn-helix domain-containing protein [Peribacillus sp. R9-11]